MENQKSIKIELVCSGHQYARVANDWKKWRQRTFGTMVSKYPFFEWHAHEIDIKCEYTREPDPGHPGKEMTTEFKLIYLGPPEGPILDQLREWFEPPVPPIEGEIARIKAKWNYDMSLEEQRGAPPGKIKFMEKQMKAELEALTAQP